MKKLLFSIFIYVLVGTNYVSAQDTGDAVISDIRYRSIVYFQPGTIAPTEAELAKHLSGFKRIKQLSAPVEQPSVLFEFLTDFEELYPVPPHDYMSRFGRGISKEQADSIQKSQHMLLMDIAYPHDMYLTGQKPVAKFLYDIATQHEGVIWDSETRELFSPNYWKDTRLKPWTDKVPNITEHITIHAYQDDNEGIRAITLGMIKFGLPDVVVNNFSWSMSNPMGNLINLTAQSLLEGAKPNEKTQINLNINELHETSLKQDLLNGLKENAVPELAIDVAEGKWEDGDPNNMIMEIVFHSAEGDSLSEKQDNTVSSLFGWEDTIVRVQHEADILAASENAKKKFKSLRKDFNNGLEPGEYILLKAPFETDQGGNEWMWVEVMTWTGTTVEGLLKNEPYYVKDLRAGAIVEFNQDDAFDYIRNYADGRSEGNETGEIMSKRYK